MQKASTPSSAAPQGRRRWNAALLGVAVVAEPVDVPLSVALVGELEAVLDVVLLPGMHWPKLFSIVNSPLCKPLIYLFTGSN